ncbi:MAG TPA: hypothetical protein VHA76_16180 [Solirubrobacterales bacterium]|nr:hypothetical protein [Solirubrobacterales bacterium]
MPTIFWIGCGFAALFCVLGSLFGARSQSSTFFGGAAIGLMSGFMLAFPLIAIGLASS